MRLLLPALPTVRTNLPGDKPSTGDKTTPADACREGKGWCPVRELGAPAGSLRCPPELPACATRQVPFVPKALQGQGFSVPNRWPAAGPCACRDWMPVFMIYMNAVSIYYTRTLLWERAKYFPFLGGQFRPCVLHIVRFRSVHTGGKLMFSRMPLFFFFQGKIRLNSPVFLLPGAERC